MGGEMVGLEAVDGGDAAEGEVSGTRSGAIVRNASSALRSSRRRFLRERSHINMAMARRRMEAPTTPPINALLRVGDLDAYELK